MALLRSGEPSHPGAAARTVIRLSFFGAFFRKKSRKNSPPHVSDYGPTTICSNIPALKEPGGPELSPRGGPRFARSLRKLHPTDKTKI